MLSARRVKKLYNISMPSEARQNFFPQYLRKIPLKLLNLIYGALEFVKV